MTARAPRTDLPRARIAQQYLAGATVTALAAEHGAAWCTIQRLLALEGVGPRPRRGGVRTDLDRAAVIADYRAGMAILAITRKYRAAHSTIGRILDLAGVERRPRGPVPARPGGSLHPVVRQLIEYRHRAGLTQTELARLAGVSMRTLNTLEKGRAGGQFAVVVALAAALGKGIRMVDVGEPR